MQFSTGHAETIFDVCEYGFKFSAFPRLVEVISNPGIRIFVRLIPNKEKSTLIPPDSLTTVWKGHEKKGRNLLKNVSTS